MSLWFLLTVLLWGAPGSGNAPDEGGPAICPGVEPGSFFQGLPDCISPGVLLEKAEQPRASSNGEFILLHRGVPGRGHLQLMDSSGSIRPLTSGQSDNLDGDISPDGRKVVFSTNKEGPHSVWLLDVDDLSQLRLSQPGLDARHPRISPVPMNLPIRRSECRPEARAPRHLVVFESRAGTKMDLLWADDAGEMSGLLAPGCGEGEWSSDGARLVLRCESGLKIGELALDVDGRPVLKPGPFLGGEDLINPAWSFNGQAILAVQRNAPRRVYAVDLDEGRTWVPVPLPEDVVDLHWPAPGDALYYEVSDANGEPRVFKSICSCALQSFSELRSYRGRPDLVGALSADGRALDLPSRIGPFSSARSIRQSGAALLLTSDLLLAYSMKVLSVTAGELEAAYFRDLKQLVGSLFTQAKERWLQFPGDAGLRYAMLWISVPEVLLREPSAPFAERDARKRSAWVQRLALGYVPAAIRGEVKVVLESMVSGADTRLPSVESGYPLDLRVGAAELRRAAISSLGPSQRAAEVWLRTMPIPPGEQASGLVVGLRDDAVQWGLWTRLENFSGRFRGRQTGPGYLEYMTYVGGKPEGAGMPLVEQGSAALEVTPEDLLAEGSATSYKSIAASASLFPPRAALVDLAAGLVKHPFVGSRTLAFAEDLMAVNGVALARQASARPSDAELWSTRAFILALDEVESRLLRAQGEKHPDLRSTVAGILADYASGGDLAGRTAGPGPLPVSQPSRRLLSALASYYDLTAKWPGLPVGVTEPAVTAVFKAEDAFEPGCLSAWSLFERPAPLLEPEPELYGALALLARRLAISSGGGAAPACVMSPFSPCRSALDWLRRLSTIMTRLQQISRKMLDGVAPVPEDEAFLKHLEAFLLLQDDSPEEERILDVDERADAVLMMRSGQTQVMRVLTRQKGVMKVFTGPVRTWLEYRGIRLPAPTFRLPSYAPCVSVPGAAGERK